MLGHIFRTIFGFYQNEYNEIWDKQLNDLISDAENGALSESEVVFDDYTINLGSHSVWIENKWYAYGSLRSVNGDQIPDNIEFRPKWKTMKRLDKLVKQVKVLKMDKEFNKYYTTNNLDKPEANL